MAGSVTASPGLFIKRHGHIVVGWALLAYILTIIRREFQQLGRVRGKILAKTAEEIVEECGQRPEESRTDGEVF
jgi:hypothetical protein